MKIRQKILSVFSAAACAMTFCIGTVSVNAETYSEEMKYDEYLSYKQVDANQDGIYDYVEISDCDESVKEVTVPDKINGLPVKSIGSSAFFDCYFLTKVDLPEGLEIIGTNAFVDCRYLESIEIPDSVTLMGKSAFQKCTHLTNIKLSKGLTKIADETFINCHSLLSVSIPNNIKSIGNGVFCGCFNMTSIKIENPECDIYDGEKVFPENAVIYGYNDSTAYTYSLKYGRKFVSLNGDIVITTPAVTTKPIVTATTVSSSSVSTGTSNSSTVPKTTLETTSTNITDITVNTVTKVSVVTVCTTPKPIAGYKITDVSCEASANDIVMDSAYMPETIVLEFLSNIDAEAVVYPEMPNGFFVHRISDKNGNNIVYNAETNSFVMKDNYAFMEFYIDNSVKPGTYEIDFDIQQSRCVENSNHNGGICYRYKYNITGGKVTVTDKNEISGDLNGDGKTGIADIVEMQKYLSNIKPITMETLKKLDLNNDGKFNVFDSIILKRQIINFEK